MRRTVSPRTGRRYPLTMICAVFRVPRSTVYRTTAPPPAAPLGAAKRGPKTAHIDAEVVEAIRAVLAASPFQSVGNSSTLRRRAPDPRVPSP
jgi:putative transposase